MTIKVRQVDVAGFEMYKAVVTTDQGAHVHVTGAAWSAAAARTAAQRWIAKYSLVTL